MTSFGATKVVRENFMPTFKVQGQIYHQAGSLLPLPDEEHKCLQIYFMGGADDIAQAQQRRRFNPGTKHRIIADMQYLFHEHNALVRLFTTAIDRMPSDDYSIVIRADKRPPGQHERRFNAPTIHEVAIVIVGEQFECRDIIIQRRNAGLQRVAETHRSYDALQYPVVFWQGEDGYHFTIKQVNPSTGERNITTTTSNNFLFVCLQLLIKIIIHSIHRSGNEQKS